LEKKPIKPSPDRIASGLTSSGAIFFSKMAKNQNIPKGIMFFNQNSFLSPVVRTARY
jgi:hypothetical protein